MKQISQKDLRKLMYSVNSSRDSLLLRVLYEIGCSLKELISIKVSHVAGNKITINGSAIRFSQISGKLSKDLKLYIDSNKLAKDNFLFSISGRRITQLVLEHSEKFLGLKLTPHDLRYLHIVHAYLTGVHIENIANQTGLTNLRLFQIIDDFNLKPERNYNNFLKRT
ncbi:MAG: hypothetical protein AABW92_05525 [Nanoarchaeota archaeon]